MDKLERYRQIIQRILSEHAELSPASGDIETMPLCDLTHDNYLLLDVGWDNTGRVHAIAFHLHIRDGKVWVEWDGVEPSIVQELVGAGISPEDIVLAYYRPERRQLVSWAHEF
jgi:hypothetical protein